MNSNAKPKISSPSARRSACLLKINGSVNPIKGTASTLMSTLKPSNEMIHAVTVVPMLAPIITPAACSNVRRPAFTKLTTMTLVAEED